MIIITGSARALPGRRDQLVAASIDIVAATRADDGCLSYGFYANLTDPELIVSVEVWRDQAALDEHMGHAHTTDFLAVAGTVVDGEPDMDIQTHTS
ncbi:antibiotic biosynthesis monooxygenase [Antrihabitans sp. YC3-6]|uniref:Antibiotic biosynthesis monooxygenase n=1 Tax=Antrihabitans stalagmiti TaxID=2799499 RepID=A0A934U6D3_9NOCA|nr:putative quinol monooxygenase [Antrihabitans stalagmiti]MBJ8342434.1 antibiotic biosynthesis monooxygenase [Antrihabitans stalagmiti]